MPIHTLSPYQLALKKEAKRDMCVILLLLACLFAAAAFLWATSQHLFSSGSHMSVFGCVVTLAGVMLSLWSEHLAKPRTGDPAWHAVTFVGFAVCAAGGIVIALAWMRA